MQATLTTSTLYTEKGVDTVQNPPVIKLFVEEVVDPSPALITGPLIFGGEAAFGA